jgi:hypothetical protein
MESTCINPNESLAELLSIKNRILRGRAFDRTESEEKELKRFSDDYAKLNKAYNEARSDALDFYYGTQTAATTQTGKKIVSGTGEAPKAQVSGGPSGTPAIAPAPVTAPVTTTKPKVTTGGTTGGTTDGSTGGITPTTGTGQAVPSNFNVGTFRTADEASMAKAEGITPGAVVSF